CTREAQNIDKGAFRPLLSFGIAKFVMLAQLIQLGLDIPLLHPLGQRVCNTCADDAFQKVKRRGAEKTFRSNKERVIGRYLHGGGICCERISSLTIFPCSRCIFRLQILFIRSGLWDATTRMEAVSTKAESRSAAFWLNS